MNCVKPNEKRMKFSASLGRVSVSRHQLRRNSVGSRNNTRHKSTRRRQSDKPKSALCTSFQNMPPSSVIRRSSGSSPSMKHSSSSTAPSILIVKTQNESLRSSYGSSDHLNTRSPHSSRGSLASIKPFEDDAVMSTASSGSMSNVSFDKVCVREYPRCIGDNVPSSGPPISIDWDHQTHQEMPIDEYERAKPLDRKRNGGELRMTPLDRISMLEDEWEKSLSDIMRASLESSSVREQRIKTITRPRSADRVEEIMESARHSLKKVSLKKVFSSSKNEKISSNAFRHHGVDSEICEPTKNFKRRSSLIKN